jgi:hypothetical protein
MDTNENIDTLLQRVETSLEEHKTPPASSLLYLSERIATVVELIREQGQVSQSVKDELLQLSNDCRILSDRDVFEVSKIDHIRSRFLSIEMNSPEIRKAYQITVELELIRIYSNKCRALDEKMAAASISADEHSMRSRLEDEVSRLTQLVNQQGFSHMI